MEQDTKIHTEKIVEIFEREKLCRVKDIGIESFVVCLEENPSDCKFSINFGDLYFCQYAVRIHIANEPKK